MRKITWRIWPALTVPDMPAYLEYMEAQGWRFSQMRLFGLVGEFRRTEPEKAMVDWDYYRLGSTMEPEEELLLYQNFYEEAGWEIAWQFERGKLFRAVDGAKAVPLHTDEEIRREKLRTYAKKEELTQGFIQLFLTIILFIAIGGRVIEDFPIMPGSQELVFILLALAFVGKDCWYFGNGIRHYAAEAHWRRSEMTGREVLWRTALTASIAAIIVFVVLQIVTMGGTSDAIVCGVAIGLIVGARVCRGMQGMGKRARRMGVKGIPHFSWKSDLLCCLILILLITFVFLPPFSGWEDKPISGSNLYCKTLYKAGDDWNSDSYYLGRSRQGADKVVDSYLKDDKWKEVSPEACEGLGPIGPYSLPEAQDIEKVYFSPLFPSMSMKESGGAGLYLIRRGSEIWVAYRDFVSSNSGAEE